VGDAPIDVTCGNAAGCTTVFVGAFPAESPAVTHHPDHIVADCKALAGLVRGSLGLTLGE
ncbi:MAG: HAD family hydrolase, partial [Rhodospirillaceae bacterium]|nr:HAD family hydrolase [Rhodospirillaceae bacterium]